MKGGSFKRVEGVDFRWLDRVVALNEDIFVSVIRWGALSVTRMLSTHSDAFFLEPILRPRIQRGQTLLGTINCS
jgi:hypothetical protein